MPTDTIRFPAPNNENMPANILNLSAYEVRKIKHAKLSVEPEQKEDELGTGQ